MGWCVLIVFGSVVSGCQTNQHNGTSETGDSLYIKAGDRLVSLTFDSLRNSLVREIGTDGLAGAITFCAENASSFTDVYSDTTIIRRTALRYRNPANRPDSLELVVLQSMALAIRSNEMPRSRIIRDNKNREIHYFKPIMTQAMCVNCHGTTSSQILPDVQRKIKELYPDDQAINFKEGELRGAWHILFISK
jgi:hypothetical protein